jgi:hypothetical protein
MSFQEHGSLLPVCSGKVMGELHKLFGHYSHYEIQLPQGFFPKKIQPIMTSFKKSFSSSQA